MKVKWVGHGFAISLITAYSYYYTAASGGRLTGPRDYEAAPHAWWRRAGNRASLVWMWPFQLLAWTGQGRSRTTCWRSSSSPGSSRIRPTVTWTFLGPGPPGRGGPGDGRDLGRLGGPGAGR